MKKILIYAILIYKFKTCINYVGTYYNLNIEFVIVQYFPYIDTKTNYDYYVKLLLSLGKIYIRLPI